MNNVAGKQSENAETMQFLSFTVGKETYGLNIISIIEIKGWVETTPLPQAPEYMRGVLNLRGAVVPIFDLRSRFGMGLTNAEATNVVIIVSLGDRTIGILVDAVSDILTIEPHQINPSPDIQSQAGNEFIDGLIANEDKMIILLNIKKLFSHKELQQAEAAAATVS